MFVLRAVHYKDGLWTFLYMDGAQFLTNDQEQAELMAEGDLPTNKYGRRVTSYIDPDIFYDCMCM